LCDLLFVVPPAHGWLFQGPSRRAVCCWWTRRCLLVSMCLSVSLRVVWLDVRCSQFTMFLSLASRNRTVHEEERLSDYKDTWQHKSGHDFQTFPARWYRNMVKHIQSSVSAAPSSPPQGSLSLNCPQDPRHLLTDSAHGSIHRGLLGFCPSPPFPLCLVCMVIYAVGSPRFHFQGASDPPSRVRRYPKKPPRVVPLTGIQVDT
jgi:hypothetical protein